MKDGYTHIEVVFDRSGSMNNIVNDMVGGLNTFIEEQKKITGTATFSLTIFDSEVELVRNFVPLENLAPITIDDVRPRGMTALNDATGRTINRTGAELAKMAEKDRPSQVICMIITDGMENSSHEFTPEQVKQMIQEQENTWKWRFTFLGANQNALFAAQKMGIRPQAAISYAANSQGVNSAMRSMSKAVSNSRGGGNLEYCQADYNEQTAAGVDPTNNSLDPNSLNSANNNLNNLNRTNQIPSLNTQVTQGQGNIRGKSRKITNIVNNANSVDNGSNASSSAEVK